MDRGVINKEMVVERSFGVGGTGLRCPGDSLAFWCRLGSGNEDFSLGQAIAVLDSANVRSFHVDLGVEVINSRRCHFAKTGCCPEGCGDACKNGSV